MTKCHYSPTLDKVCITHEVVEYPNVIYYHDCAMLFTNDHTYMHVTACDSGKMLHSESDIYRTLAIK